MSWQPGPSQAAAAGAPGPVLHPVVEMVRLPAENLDRLVRSTGQILSESLRLSERKRRTERNWMLRSLKCRRKACGSVRPRLRPLWRLAAQPEFSAVTRYIGLIEQKARSLTVQSRAARLLQQRSDWNMRRSAEQLQRDVWSARMAPAEDLFEGFRRMVRDLARRGEQGNRFPAQRVRCSGRPDHTPGPEGSSDAFAAERHQPWN